MTYEEAVRYIEDIPWFTKKTELSNSRRMLKLLGDPLDKIDIVHVAGTNGKGSVCAFAESICREAGRRTGMFTSPHLTDIRERIRINGQMVSKQCFAGACERMRVISEQMVREGFQHPAYFEFLFGMAADIFEREQIDTAIVETGLGGRLDATNAAKHPAVTVITSVSMDHMEYLGHTIEEIAEEKAGIIKEGVPVVYWGADKRAARVIEAEAEKKHAKAIKLTGENYEILKIGNKDIDFYAFCGYHENNLYSLPFSAPYQAENAVLAIQAVLCLDRSIGGAAIRKGLSGTVWQGRMEEVAPGIFVDGAHNEDGVRAFAKAVKANQNNSEKYLLFSAVKEKDCDKMVRILCEEIGWRSVILTEIEGGRRLAGSTMRDLFLRYKRKDTELLVYPDNREAFSRAREKKKDGILYCAGSLYLVGEIKKLLMKEQAR